MWIEESFKHEKSVDRRGILEIKVSKQSLFGLQARSSSITVVLGGAK